MIREKMVYTFLNGWKKDGFKYMRIGKLKICRQQVFSIKIKPKIMLPSFIVWSMLNKKIVD